MRLVLALLLLLLSIPLLAEQQSSKTNPPANFEQLTDEIKLKMNRHRVAGFSLALIDHNGNEYSIGLGLANKEQQIPATENTLFRIGSVSKMFVSMAALRLQEQGKLDLNTPFKDLAPEIEFSNPWHKTDPVRLVHLLEHTSGWDDMHLAEYASNDATPLTLKQGLDLHPHSRTSRWKPGQATSYSNSGPAAAAYAIEKITGMDFELFVKNEIFEHLGMRTATFQQPSEELVQATLYEGKGPKDYWHLSLRPSGAINASAKDMLGLVRFFVNRGEVNGSALISPSSITRMEEPNSSLAAQAGLTLGYGLNNYPATFNGHVFHGHGGNINGGSAEFNYLPEAKLGYAFAINAKKGAFSKEVSNLIKTYLTSHMEKPELPAPINISVNTIKKYSGYYVPTNPRLELSRFIDNIFGIAHIELTTDGFVISGDRRAEFVATSDKTFRVSDKYQTSAILLEHEGKPAIQVGSRFFVKTSSVSYLAKYTLAILFIVCVVLNFLWLFIWGIRKLKNKIKNGVAIQIRVWPLYASVSILLAFISFVIGQSIDMFGLLGKPSIWSLLITISTITFALSSVYGLWINVKNRKQEINRFAHLFCLVSSLIFTMSTLYLASFGIIGLMTFDKI